ncbi:pilus assembly protein TadG-related protein [Sagittula sp. S175]|uniref:pilus assembly protein TadG-related protein n=1 Tax=Sagittula sp. S175 TaxID=3415129 RepID=UPI003C79C6B9
MSRIDFWQDESGNVAVMVALTLTVLMGFVALGVDGGSMYRARAQVQAVSDLVAVSAMRDTETAQVRADEVARANALPEAVQSVEVGRYRRNPALLPEARFEVLEPGIPGANAVRVTLTDDTPLHFAQVISDRSSVRLTTSAMAARTGAARFSLTSHLARLDGAKLNAALSAGLGVTVALSAGEIDALAATRLSLGEVLAVLGQQTGLAERNPAAILDKVTTAGALARAARELAPEASGLDVALGSAVTLPLAELVAGADTSLGLTVSEALAGAEISALDLLRAMAAVGLSDHGVEVDTAADIPGLTDVSARVQLADKPAVSGWMMLGEEGVTLHRPAARVFASLDVAPALLGALASGVTVTKVNLPVTVELAGATATLDEITCDAPDPATEVARFITAPTPLHPANGTSVAALYLGTLEAVAGSGPIDPAALGFADLLTLDLTIPVPLLPDIRVADLVVQVRSAATVGQSMVEEIAFTRSDLQAGDTLGRFGSGGLLGSAVTGLLDPAHTEIRLKPGQEGLVSGVAASLLSIVLTVLPQRLLETLAAPLDATLHEVLTEAGLALGEGELELLDLNCEAIRLVQ